MELPAPSPGPFRHPTRMTLEALFSISRAVEWGSPQTRELSAFRSEAVAGERVGSSTLTGDKHSSLPQVP
jgi:hypothetical protein